VKIIEKLSGVVERITYCNAENGFSVLKIRSKGYSSLVSAVGNMAHVKVGTVVALNGKWIIDKKFGRQFSVETCEETLPASIYGIEKYLGSGLIHGIGPRFAKLIVKTFGRETLKVIENSPEKLAKIPKISGKRISLIQKSWNEHKDIKNLMIFLQETGVSVALGHKIYKVYGKESIEKIKKNPYSLADDIYGIGFLTADIIAQKLGTDRESYNRCRAGIFYILSYFANVYGHCFVPLDELTEKCAEILGIEETKIIMTCRRLIKIKELFIENSKFIYLPAFYRSEIGLAKRIKNIAGITKFKQSKQNKQNKILSEPDFKTQIQNLQNKNNIEYDESQIRAIKTSVNSRFSVITGGAGVGKTTITRAIIEIFKNSGKEVLLAAPTGRAAKRMTESCGFEAKTIHRLLGAKPKGEFEKNAENPLIGDILIIDEASMVDLILMYNLLKSVPDNMAVILIGDVNQLPSVGAGNVLKDIIKSEKIPVSKLSKIYRQSLKSNIIINSHKINNGEMPDLKCGFDSDFFFIEKCDSNINDYYKNNNNNNNYYENNYENNNNNGYENDYKNETVNLISELCANRLPNFYKVSPISDIQVLTPMKKGILGTDNLNKVLQSKLNKSKTYLKHGADEYREGDKAMQMKNNYYKDIFNGDIGIIKKVNSEDKKLTVNFDGKLIDYDISELEELNLAYAITVHKSQGGEYPIIIMPVTFKHKIMLERNLLYTGVTRAKKICILIGEKPAVKFAIENNASHKRYTMLAERLMNNL
jgi:exodeoxyribonuclease V alpha subunit